MASRETYRHGDLPEAVRDEALRLVRERGVHDFSLRGAARAVGVDVAAIYRHYRDKQDLLRAVARVGFLSLRAAMDAERAARTSPRERFRAVGHVYVAFAVREPELFRLMCGPFGAGSAEPLFAEGDGVTFGVLIESLEALRASGDCAWPVPDAATAAWSAVHGLATLLVDGPVPAEQQRARTEVVIDVLMAGLRTGRPPQGAGPL